MTTTRYTARDLFTLLARLIKPITDAIAAEFPARPTPAPTTTPNPGRKVVGLIATPVEFVPECAAAFSMSGAPVPSMAPWLDIAPIGVGPARKPSTRKAAPKRDETGTHGTLNWDAATKTVAIKSGRNSCTYAVTETATDWEGRAFRLDKLEAGSDPESRTYSVFVCSKGQEHRCDCKGFEMGNGKPCRHVNALKALTATARV